METFPKIPEPIILEHRLAELMQDQKRVGWPLDVKKAKFVDKTYKWKHQNR